MESFEGVNVNTAQLLVLIYLFENDISSLSEL